MIIRRINPPDGRINIMIEKITDKLDSNRILDYEVSDSIPDDVISITSDPKSFSIYIPLSLEYFQYKLDDFIRSMVSYSKSQTVLDRDIFKMTSRTPLSFDQYYRLIKFIISSTGFCTILTF